MNQNRIYLTGISAVGKTTLTEMLNDFCDDFEIISYSGLLKEYINNKNGTHISNDELRVKSSSIVTSLDVHAVDEILVERVSAISNKHIIIDSHAVTVEIYGFRVIPFNKWVLKRLNLNCLISLFASPSEIVNRQEKSNKIYGREAHNNVDNIMLSIALQNSLMINYSYDLGLPAYYIDTSSMSKESIRDIFLRIVGTK